MISFHRKNDSACGQANVLLVSVLTDCYFLKYSHPFTYTRAESTMQVVYNKIDKYSRCNDQENIYFQLYRNGNYVDVLLQNFLRHISLQ